MKVSGNAEIEEISIAGNEGHATASAQGLADDTIVVAIQSVRIAGSTVHVEVLSLTPGPEIRTINVPLRERRLNQRQDDQRTGMRTVIVMVSPLLEGSQ